MIAKISTPYETKTYDADGVEVKREYGETVISIDLRDGKTENVTLILDREEVEIMAELLTNALKTYVGTD